MAFINTYDPTADDAFNASLSAIAGSSLLTSTVDCSDVRQGEWDFTLTCTNVTTAGSLINIGEIYIDADYWQHVSTDPTISAWVDQAPILLARFWSDDTITQVLGTPTSGVGGDVFTLPLRAGLKLTVTLYSYYAEFRDGYTIGMDAVWNGG